MIQILSSQRLQRLLVCHLLHELIHTLRNDHTHASQMRCKPHLLKLPGRNECLLWSDLNQYKLRPCRSTRRPCHLDWTHDKLHSLREVNYHRLLRVILFCSGSSWVLFMHKQSLNHRHILQTQSCNWSLHSCLLRKCTICLNCIERQDFRLQYFG